MASTDRSALLALFRSTGGASHWRDNTNWNTDAELSRWYGVFVNDEGRVDELWLDENNLQGGSNLLRRQACSLTCRHLCR